jgi:hypothetical protein
MEKKIAITLVIIIIILLGGGFYFFNCSQNNPLFINNRKDTKTFVYNTGDRLQFCWNFLSQPKTPKGPDLSTAVPILGTRTAFRIEKGTEHPPYNSHPPTSGWNYKISGTQFNQWRPSNNKTYQDLIPSEVAVAKLYDGFVWITYQSGEVSEAQIKAWREAGISENNIGRRIGFSVGKQGVPEDIIEELKKIAASTPGVFVTGRIDNGGSDIALNALGRQDKFNLEVGELAQKHTDRIWDFILRYRNQPEPRAQDFLEPEQKI